LVLGLIGCIDTISIYPHHIIVKIRAQGGVTASPALPPLLYYLAFWCFNIVFCVTLKTILGVALRAECRLLFYITRIWQSHFTTTCAF
jgi:hypothetical protein